MKQLAKYSDIKSKSTMKGLLRQQLIKWDMKLFNKVQTYPLEDKAAIY